MLSNVFNMPTNDDWKKRRKILSKPFGNAVIKNPNQVDILQSIINKLIEVLHEYEKSGEAVDIDELFS